MITPKRPREELDLEQRLSEIRLLVIEMEGALTDGTTTCDHQGRESITTCRADQLALAQWRQAGNLVVVVAREDLEAARAWCEKRGFTFRPHQGHNKAALMQTIIFEHELTPPQVCYLGAELDDLPAMMVAGVAAAPAGANPWAQGAAHLVLSAQGGAGAVRELVEQILERQHPERKLTPGVD